MRCDVCDKGCETNDTVNDETFSCYPCQLEFTRGHLKFYQARSISQGNQIVGLMEKLEEMTRFRDNAVTWGMAEHEKVCRVRAIVGEKGRDFSITTRGIREAIKAPRPVSGKSS